MLEFKDKVVLVTGSSHGIGRSIAISFAKEGANVVINYRNSDIDASVAYDIVSSYGNKCMCIKADVSKEEEVKKMIDKIIAEYGKIDVLVNNAGIAIDADFEDKTVRNWQDTLNTNVLGPFLTTKYAGRKMFNRQYGKIINISSTNGIHTIFPYSADYDASKAALINLTKNAAIQYAPYVNVNSVAPGWVDTPMNAELPKSYLKEEKEKTLLKRFAEPEEIANVVLFLASDKARYITAEVISVSGGLKV